MAGGLQKPDVPFACAAASRPKKIVLKIIRNDPVGCPRQLGLNAINTTCPLPRLRSSAAAYPWRYFSAPAVRKPDRSGVCSLGYLASTLPSNPSSVVNAGGLVTVTSARAGI